MTVGILLSGVVQAVALSAALALAVAIGRAHAAGGAGLGGVDLAAHRGAGDPVGVVAAVAADQRGPVDVTAEDHVERCAVVDRGGAVVQVECDADCGCGAVAVCLDAVDVGLGGGGGGHVGVSLSGRLPVCV